MQCFTLNLQNEYSFVRGGELDCLLAENPWDVGAEDWRRPAVVVVPGGGYGMVSRREGEPIASAFFARGFQVFILRYTVGGENGLPYPEQLLELASAVDYIKKHANALRVNPDEVFAVGFSAGGHLVANLAVEQATFAETHGVSLDCSLTAAGLSYPVITRKHGHEGSFENLLYGCTEEEQANLSDRLNLDEAVTEQTAPSFIWATSDDNAVPADNALRFALALARHDVPYEIHVYPHGQHGLSTGSLEVNAPAAGLERISGWLDDCAAFFRLYTQEKF